MKLFIGSKPINATKQGINYKLDLSEAIDFSIFIFGSFQSHIFNNKYLQLSPNAVVFDIGANIGAMSLKFAKKFPGCVVYAFEPTHYALEKLKVNLSLNPNLAKRILVENIFISKETSASPNINAYSSWKLEEPSGSERHSIHLGIAKSAEGVSSITMDDFCDQKKIERLDMIKIDTDGHEFEILLGAKKAIKRFRPLLIIEVGQYVMEEKGIGFEFYHDYFKELNYVIIDLVSGNKLDMSNQLKYVPAQGTTDILALPQEKFK